MSDDLKQQDDNMNQKDSEQLLLEDEKINQLVLEHPSYKQLSDELTKLEQQAQDNRNGWLMVQAELENLKRRTEREIASAHKYAIEKFAQAILVTVDNLERSLATKLDGNEALKDFYLGIELTLKSLLEVLDKFGITPINPLQEDFNHEKHTALATKEAEGVKSNTILEVIQKGYWFKDRLLRPALVVVAK